jgi:stearoyl-CoA desaturase (delta-9 desaturase)
MLDKNKNGRYSNSVGNLRRFFGGYHFGAVALFAMLHAAVLAAFFVPFTASLAVWLLATYSVRMFGISAGYHRYFSHRSYRLGRLAQFLMAFLAQTSAQKGVLWWAAQHRDHHRYSDHERDIHSPWQRGFWWAHVGWVLSNEHDDYDPKKVADMARFPELLWLDRYHWFPTVVFAAFVLIVGGPAAFVWGYAISTVVLYHCTFAINSMAHLFGSRRFDTGDQSRNNWLLALLTFGEGWHNNHHFSMGSCRQGIRWWEIDVTYGLLKVLAMCGIARDLRPFRIPAPRTQEAE